MNPLIVKILIGGAIATGGGFFLWKHNNTPVVGSETVSDATPMYLNGAAGSGGGGNEISSDIRTSSSPVNNPLSNNQLSGYLSSNGVQCFQAPCPGVTSEEDQIRNPQILIPQPGPFKPPITPEQNTHGKTLFPNLQINMTQIGHRTNV